jgi:hypothetical protein
LGRVHAGLDEEDGDDDDDDPFDSQFPFTRRDTQRNSPSESAQNRAGKHRSTPRLQLGIQTKASSVVDGVVIRSPRSGPSPGRQPKDGVKNEGADKEEAEVHVRRKELCSQHASKDKECEDGLIRMLET